jgi:succinate dehydrogenase / fumarate reductase membrane anchor subunit
MVKPVIVGAHYGFRDWLAQRVTAVVMALYTVIFAISALMLPDAPTRAGVVCSAAVS